MITKKEVRRLLSLRDNQVTKELIKFDLKAIGYSLLFILCLIWIRVLHVYYVVPRCGGGTDFGVAYGSFIIVTFFICFECIMQKKYIRDCRIFNIENYYNSFINHSEAMRLAYKSMDIELIDSDEIVVENVPVFSGKEYDENYVNDFEYLSEDDFTDEELGIKTDF